MAIDNSSNYRSSGHRSGISSGTPAFSLVLGRRPSNFNLLDKTPVTGNILFIFVQSNTVVIQQCFYIYS